MPALAQARAFIEKAERHTHALQGIKNKVDAVKETFEVKAPSINIDVDAAKNGPIYGDPEGLVRVKALEAKLHNIGIKKDHPRIFLDPDNINVCRQRILRRHPAFNNIIDLAEKGDIVNLAFLYLMREHDNPATALRCSKEVIRMLVDNDPTTGDKRFVGREIAKMALAFDWIYNAMTDSQRKYVAEKLSNLAGIKKRAKAIREGLKETGETFHREDWMFDSYRAWPEIALAHHVPDAEFVYKSRWNHDWFWGDAARMYAYAADGTPFEGYYAGADGVDWFLALKSATGINLIDGEDYPWFKNTAYYIFYRLDLERGREALHHGVTIGGAGCISYTEGSVAWKMKKFLGRTLPLAYENPYIKWVGNHQIGVSDWILTTTGYGGLEELGPIASVLFDDLHAESISPNDAAYENFPYAKLFSGGDEAYMRSGWTGKPTIIGFRSAPAYTKTSHGDFDVNTFVIYKDGVLAPDSGVYDAYVGQSNYFCYQKNTAAHNNILVIDPFRPDEPKKFGTAPDPGGVDFVFTRTFGASSRFGREDEFLHNPHADWADLAAFKTTPNYDYVVGKANKAYRDRLDKYYRTLVFIRKGNGGYLIVYDQLKLKNKNYQIKWLLHLVTEPVIKGQIVKSEVPGHIEIYKGYYLNAKNVFNTSSLFLKTLKPENYLIRKVGGSGYEYWVDGSKPKNYPVADSEKKRIEEQMGGKWQEAGTWRIEIMPQDKRDQHDFINVFYIGDADEQPNPNAISLKEDASSYIINIEDELAPTTVTFLKGEEPKGSIIIKDKINDTFPDVKKR